MDNVYAYITATGLLLINIITPVKGGELLDKIIVTGGNTIRGEVTISGAKNAVLPIIAGALLSKDITILHDVPNLSDVRIMFQWKQPFHRRSSAWHDRNQGCTQRSARPALPVLHSRTW